MQGLTESMYDNLENAKLRKPKPSTMGIPPSIKARLKTYKLFETEPDYNVIERLMDEHDIRTMRKVVAKRVR